MRGKSLAVPTLLVCLVVCAGCGSSGAAGYPEGGAPHDGAIVDGGDGSIATYDGPTLGGEGGNPEGGTGGTAEVFAESLDTLFKLDPTTKAVTVVGMFQGCSQVVDIALDKDSNMYATTIDGFYKVDRTSAACTLIQMGSGYPNSLSFVPAGTLDPNVEALVGYVNDQYVRIDP